MRIFGMVAFVLPFFCSPTAAQIVDISACATRTLDSERLKCYDDTAKAAKDEKSSAPSTKEIVASRSVDPARTIDAEDLYIAPDKFTGKHIELRQVKCFHADKDEFRCIGNGHFALMILTVDITPTEAKDQIERDCGQIKKISSAPCRKTIRFIPLSNTQDQINALTKRTVIIAKSLEVVSARRRR